MNRVLVATFSFVILVIASVVSFNVLYDETATFSSACKNEDFVIIIDAGHGGEDGGTSAKDGTLEKNINLSILQFYFFKKQLFSFPLRGENEKS